MSEEIKEINMDCFIIMPITTPDTMISIYANDRDHFRHVLECLFIPAIKKAGMTPIPPIASGSDVIHGNIIENLDNNNLVLCDISTLNANVFFELGIRTALDKPVCYLKDDKTEGIPFDTTIINHHTYLSSLNSWEIEDQISQLSEHILKSFSKSKGGNNLWKYFGVNKAASTLKEVDKFDKLDVIFQQLQNISNLLQISPRAFNVPEMGAMALEGLSDEQLNKIQKFRDAIKEAGVKLIYWKIDKYTPEIQLTIEEYVDKEDMIIRTAKIMNVKIKVNLRRFNNSATISFIPDILESKYPKI